MQGLRRMRGLVAAVAFSAGTLALTGCTADDTYSSSTDWAREYLQDNSFFADPTSEAQSGSASSGSARNSRGALVVWSAKGSEFSDATLELLQENTGLTITQEIKTIAEIQQAAAQISSTIGSNLATDATESSDSSTAGTEEIAESDLPDLIIGLDESTIDTSLASSGGATSGADEDEGASSSTANFEATAVNLTQYGRDFVCVLALREYYSANNQGTPSSWGQVTAASSQLQIADPSTDSTTRAFLVGLDDGEGSGSDNDSNYGNDTSSDNSDTVWDELASGGTQLVDEYPSFDVELGIDGAPTVEAATENAVSQPVLRVASALTVHSEVNNLGTESPLSLVSGTCVERSVFALANSERGSQLVEYLLTDAGQQLLTEQAEAYPLEGSQDMVASGTSSAAASAVLEVVPSAHADLQGTSPSEATQIVEAAISAFGENN